MINAIDSGIYQHLSSIYQHLLMYHILSYTIIPYTNQKTSSDLPGPTRTYQDLPRPRLRCTGVVIELNGGARAVRPGNLRNKNPRSMGNGQWVMVIINNNSPVIDVYIYNGSILIDSN